MWLFETRRTMISSTMEQPSFCTGENNPKGSSTRKLTTRVQKLCLEVRLMNAHPVQEKTTLWVHPLKNDNMGAKNCA